MHVREPSYVSWRPPQEGWVQVNSDGLMLRNKRAACKGLVRESIGCFLAQ